MNTYKTKHEETTESVSKRVLEAIEEKKITPTARWKFLLRRSVLWGTGALAVIVGAVAVAAALYSLEHSGFRYYAVTHTSLASFLISTLPYVWIIALAAFSWIAYYNIRHTEGGYRYPFAIIISLSVLGSVGLGTLLYADGLGRVIDERAGNFAPFYTPTVMVQKELWHHPEDGRLAGEVVSFSEEEGVLVVRTFDGILWRVLTEDLREPDIEALKAFEAVRVVGVPTTSAETLHACFILPWEFIDMPPHPEPRKLFEEFLESKGERMSEFERSSECKGVRPYQAIIRIQKH